MIVTLNRERQLRDATIGTLSVAGVECYTLEDIARTKKVYGETRIPAGSYEIKLRTVGGFHERYSRIFGDWHKGMLWLQDVPEFEFILIHMGNVARETHGCVLVGETVQGNEIRRSRDAYRRVYPVIRDALVEGTQVIIEVNDER